MPRKAKPARGLPRLVQQPDGYAYYVEDVRVPRSDGEAETVRSRRRRLRQRPIRTTISLLLIIPLVSLVGLWAYAFSVTVPAYLATRSSSVVNNDIGKQVAGLEAQLEQEASYTYLLHNMPPLPSGASLGKGTGQGAGTGQASQGAGQSGESAGAGTGQGQGTGQGGQSAGTGQGGQASGPGQGQGTGQSGQGTGQGAGTGTGTSPTPGEGGQAGGTQTPSPAQEQQELQELKKAQAETANLARMLKAQIPATNAAIANFRAGQAKVDKSGDFPAQAKPAAATLLAELGKIPSLRAEASHKTNPLTVFNGYLTVIKALFPYASAIGNSNAPVPQFSQGMGTLIVGEATVDMTVEATLGEGAEEAGGVLSPSAYQLFTQSVDSQRQLNSAGSELLHFRHNAGNDPYLKVIASPQFKKFQTLENQIIDAGPGGKLPAGITATTWQEETQHGVLRQLAAAVNAEGATVTSDSAQQTNTTEYQTFGVGGAGLLLVLVASFLLLRFGRRISRELHILSETARWLPGVVSRLRAGRNLETLETAETEAPPQRLNTKTLEVAETAEAFTAVQRTAVEAALKEAMLRKAVNNVFRSLARRNQSLLQRQLKMLDEMERGTDDPDALGQLFRLDHLTTRMRRQAEGLIILSGATPGRGWRGPVQVVEVLRGAIGEIEDYARVDLSTDSHDYLQGAGVADVIHLLAELIENAVVYSPPGTRVQVRGVRVARGYAVEVEDRGLGIHDEIRETLNQRLEEPPDFDVADSDQLGLFVVSRLAARHGIKVSLRGSAYGGTTAIVLLPQSLVVTAEEAAYLAAQEHGVAPGRPGAVSWAGGEPVSWPGGTGSASWSAVGNGAVGNGAVGNGAGGNGAGGSGSWPVPAGATSVDVYNSGQTRPDGDVFLPGTSQSGLARTGTGNTGPIQGDTYPDGVGPGGLPQRRRTSGASGATPSREPSGTMRGPGPVTSRSSSPEQARALLTSIQRGLRSGRETDVGNGERPPWDNQ